MGGAPALTTLLTPSLRSVPTRLLPRDRLSVYLSEISDWIFVVS